MTHPPTITNPEDALGLARAKLFAEIAAECSAGIFPGDYSEAGISTFAAEAAEFFWEMRIAEADRRSQIEQPPAEAALKASKPPTLASVAKQASKAGIEVARYEVKPDGTVGVVTCASEQQQSNELDEWIAKHARAPERH